MTKDVARCNVYLTTGAVYIAQLVGPARMPAI